jgi:hypothetical protein
MRNRRTASTVAVTTLALAMTLAGCSAAPDDPGSAAPGPAATQSAQPSVPVEAQPLLAQFGLAGMDAVQVIDHLDRLGGAERPADLRASVRPGELLLSSGGQEHSLAIPDDRFYLSVAPYVTKTHDCYNHSLTTCQGELGSTDVHVKIVDETSGQVLVDGTRTTFENGFVGFWLPSDIEGTVQVTYAGKAGQVGIRTAADAPTCLTTLQLT